MGGERLEAHARAGHAATGLCTKWAGDWEPDGPHIANHGPLETADQPMTFEHAVNGGASTHRLIGIDHARLDLSR